MRNIVIGLSMALLVATGTAAADIRADHTCISEFDQIPGTVIADIASGYTIYYGHTSHGSQIMSGLDYVEAENALYVQPVFHEVGDDLGHSGDTTWVPDIRAWLDGHPDCNMVMMSWCGGASDNTEAGINIYLDKMNALESDYPGVTFVYMTGHLDGTGPTGPLYQNNNMIRAYCQTHDKILFDFADIESYDPDGNYYPDETDACGWCVDWCMAYSCCDGSCAHSHCFNCYLKGKAWWWMMATIDGWSPTMDVGDDGRGALPISFELSQNYPNPFNPTTMIEFHLSRNGHVTLELFDLLGRLVEVLVDEPLGAGEHRVRWNTTDYSTGVYFYRLQMGTESATRKMLLLR